MRYKRAIPRTASSIGVKAKIEKRKEEKKEKVYMLCNISSWSISCLFEQSPASSDRALPVMFCDALSPISFCAMPTDFCLI